MAVLLTSGGWIVAAALTTLVVTKSNDANAMRNDNLWSVYRGCNKQGRVFLTSNVVFFLIFVESRSTRKTRRTPSIAAGVQLATQRSTGWYAASKCSVFVFLRCGKHHTTRIEGVQGAFVLSQGEECPCVFLVLRVYITWLLY